MQTVLFGTRVITAAVVAAALVAACSGPAPGPGTSAADTAADGMLTDTALVEHDAGEDVPPMESADAAAGAQTGRPDTVQAGTGVVGRVVASGTEQEPITMLQVEGRMALVVTGALEPELRSLAGATVRARGPESGAARRTIRVDSYEIVEINGERPFVGVVLTGGRLAVGPDTLTLAGAPAGMESGTRVWITGDREGGRLRVSSWGVIRGRIPD
jgi:hypothetical protein